MITWANDVRNYALNLATNGHTIPGYKLVEGRSIRKFSDEKKVIQTVTAAGFDPYEKKLLNINRDDLNCLENKPLMSFLVI